MPIFSGVHDRLLQIFNKVCSTLFPAAAGDVMRWIRRILLVLVVIPLILIGCTDLWLHTSLPETTGALVVSGPSSEIRIARDAVGVPHIVAANDADATFALGFVHAQDRLFQMDMMRRLGAGRLSELFGEGTIGTDRTMRTLGLYRAAQRQLAELSAPLRAAFASYAANNWGVDGKHTVSGKPLLANDPHLDFATPDIWYLARLDTPDLHLAGATSPGAPFIVIGHNQRIGWGFTTTEGDVEDLFIERIDPADPNHYLAPAALAPGGSLPF